MYRWFYFSKMRKQVMLRLFILLFGLGMAATVLPSQTIPALGVLGEVKAFCAADETEIEEASHHVNGQKTVKKQTVFVSIIHFSGSENNSLKACLASFSRTLIFFTPVSRRVRMNP